MRVFAALLIACIGILAVPAIAEAQSVSIRPLVYEATLEEGETKRGVVDISNPTDEEQRYEVSVQAFRQIDNKGTLEFFDDEAVEEGVQLDLETTTLEAGKTQRVVFELDGAKLPSGDVFAAIFASTRPENDGENTRVAQAVRVGTLLVVENGTPVSRDAEVTGLALPRVVFDGQINGTYRVRNTAAEGAATGFFPEVTIDLSPFHDAQTETASLLFAGRERDNQFSYPTNAAGLYRVSVGYQDSQQQRYVLLLPAWSLLVLAGLIASSIGGAIVYRRHRAKLKTLKKG